MKSDTQNLKLSFPGMEPSPSCQCTVSSLMCVEMSEGVLLANGSGAGRSERWRISLIVLMSELHAERVRSASSSRLRGERGKEPPDVGNEYPEGWVSARDLLRATRAMMRVGYMPYGRVVNARISMRGIRETTYNECNQASFREVDHASRPTSCTETGRGRYPCDLRAEEKDLPVSRH